MDEETKNYIDKGDEVTRAQNDAQFAMIREVIGGLKLWVVGVGAVSFVSIVGVLIGLLSFGGDRFDGGISAADIIVQSKENANQISQLIETNRERDRKIDALLTILQERTNQ